MNNKGKSSIRKSTMGMNASTLMRLAGVSAMLTGLCIIVMGMFHPMNVPEAVATSTWVNVHIVATAMGIFGLFGMAGLYARQSEETGWLGLTGFVLFSLWFGLIMPFCFVEAFILPSLINESPAFVAGFLGMFSSLPSEVDLGLLPTLWNISGPLFIFGPLLFGIATFRARILSRWGGGLLALGAFMIPVGGMVPVEYQPEVALIPIGLAMTWLGISLFSERVQQASESVVDQSTDSAQPGKAV